MNGAKGRPSAPAKDSMADGELPEIPESIGLPATLLGLLHLAYFLDNAEESVVDADAAARQLERVGLYVQRLSDEELDELDAGLAELTAYAEEAGWPEDAQSWLAEFLEYCGIAEGDEDAGDDEAPGGLVN